MDFALDEYLGNIEWYNITDNNIHQYIKKNSENGGHFLDTLALVTNYSKSQLNIEFAKDLLNNYGYSSNDIYNLYIQCEDLMGVLLQIPGRGNIHRLYRYGEQIIKYLGGNILLMNRIIKKHEVEDDEVSNLISKTNHKKKDYSKSIERSLEIAHVVNEFETCLQNSVHNFSDELRDIFYQNCKEYLCSSEDIAMSQIVEGISERKKRIIEDKEMYQNKRCKSNEMTWSQVVREKGYHLDKAKLRLCGTYGKSYKKLMGYDTSENKYYYDRDRKMMDRLVEYVYNGGDNPIISLS
ncbi:MAG: hypothetical protein CMB64_04920 [Euryarchaeota archaeon]|nr:hypothetical protein [Euryarchaeota archaeon]|tara:strand:+ start:395 stop:1279 length:885 start_codon:yes stop_codon:yes gene_type:complete